MAVYFKFKSAKDFDSIPIDGHFISVCTLKEKIFESKHLGRGTDFDLVVTNAHTNEEYLDEDMLIPKNTSVLIRRVPGRPRMPIVTEPVNEQYEPKIENNQSGDIQTTKSSFMVVDSSTAGYPEDVEWDEFGTDLYAIPEAQASQLSNLVHDNTIAHSKEDEDSKIKALIDTPVLDWQRQSSDGFGAGRGFGRGGGRMMGGRGFGRGGGGVLERKTPPPGYICHRCKVSGHFIQHCPTNGDPNFDIKRVKPPTGIPKSMLMATPDGSYSLPSGAAAVLKPNEDAFAREMLGLPSTHLVSDLPPELRCPLCTEVMKDAVLTSKCCFRSFCDKCIRNYFMSKQMCVCGAKNILADDLLPNKTVRDTISRIMESTNSSQENVGSTFQVQDMESKFPEPNLKDKTPSSPTVSATSKGKEIVLPPHDDGVLKANESSAQVNAVFDSSDKMLEKSGTGKVPDVSEATHDSISVKEPASQISGAPLVDEEVQQKPVISDAGKKKKKKKTRPPMNEMQWKMTQDLGAENYMMPMGGPAAYNPYWNGMQPGMEAYGAPHYPGSLPYMGYGFGGPLDVPFGMMPQDPFGGVQQGFMMPPIHPQQRDLAELGMGFNMGHHPHQPAPIMSREEFEARKADLRMKREFERRGAVGGGERRDSLLPKDQQQQPQPRGGGVRQISSSSRDGPPPQQQLKPKPKMAPSSALPPSSSDYRHRPERSSPERSSARGPDAPRPSSKRKSSEYDQEYDRRDDHHRDSRDRDREHHNRRHRAESSSVARSSSPTPPIPSQQPHQTSSKLKPSVFSRISFPEGEKLEAAAAAAAAGEGSKKRKMSSSGTEAPMQNGHHRHHEDYKISSSSSKTVTSGSVVRKNVADYESSDDDRHFKRRPSRYESSPAPIAAVSSQHEDSRHSRGTRDRERERDRDRKHR